MRESNVDTDQIIPAHFLKRITKTGFEDALFSRWRTDEDFILNKEPYSSGTVLVTGPDFGTGSSREHAVWALRDYGFKAVISARFGDIFRSNAGKQGLVAAQVEQSDVELIWKELENNPGAEVTVDLENRLIECGSISTRFQIDDYTRWRLMEGLDDIGLTLRSADAIDEFEKTRPAIKPTTLPAKLSEV
ncbi:MAG: 3-isopropylmalate dehydratase small subunit [Yaniella sp.]|nr:3-isopropylmalate dehydratase small subunit [Yaniella sp.]